MPWHVGVAIVGYIFCSIAAMWLFEKIWVERKLPVGSTEVGLFVALSLAGPMSLLAAMLVFIFLRNYKQN